MAPNSGDPHPGLVTIEDCPIKAAEVTGAFSVVQASLTGAIACMVEKHNSLVKRFNDAHKILSSLVESNGKLLNRLEHAEAGQQSIFADLRSEMANSADASMKELKRRADDIIGMQAQGHNQLQERLRAEIAAAMEEQLAKASTKHATDLEAAIAPLRQRLVDLENVDSCLDEKLRVGFRDLREDTVKAMAEASRGIDKTEFQASRINLLEASHEALAVQVSALTASMSERRGDTTNELICQRLDGVGGRFEALEAATKALEEKILANKEAPIDSLQASHEALVVQVNSLTASMSDRRQDTTNELSCQLLDGVGSRLEALEAATEALEEKLLASKEAPINPLKTTHEVLVVQATTPTASVSEPRHDTTNELNCQRIDDVGSRLEALEAATEALEAKILANKEDGSDADASYGSPPAPWHREVADILSRISDLDSRQTLCSVEFAQLKKIVSNLRGVVEVMKQFVNGMNVPSADPAAAITTLCLSCGVPRLPAASKMYASADHAYRPTSARTRSASPPLLAPIIKTDDNIRVFTGGFRDCSPTEPHHDEDAAPPSPPPAHPSQSSPPRPSYGKRVETPPVYVPHVHPLPRVPGGSNSSSTHPSPGGRRSSLSMRGGAACADNGESAKVTLPTAHAAYRRPNSARARLVR